MKKALFLLIAIASVAAFTGCGGGDAQAKDAGPVVEQPTGGAPKDPAGGSASTAEMAPNISESEANANLGGKAGDGK